MNKFTLSKVPKEGRDGWFIIRAEWLKGSFCITVLEDDVAWSGEVNSEEVSNFSRQVDLSVNDYIDETRKALKNDGVNQFSYSLEDEQFIWKKMVGNIKVKFGYVRLTKIPGHSFFNNFISTLLDEIHEMQDQIQSLNVDKENLSIENEHLVRKLELFTEEKTHQISTLYGKFLNILNTKKERILQLETNETGRISPEQQRIEQNFSNGKSSRCKQCNEKLRKKKCKKSYQRYQQELKLGNEDAHDDSSDTDFENSPQVVSSSSNSKYSDIPPKRKHPTSPKVATIDEDDSDTDAEGEFARESDIAVNEEYASLPKRKCSNKTDALSSPQSASKDANHFDSDTEVDEIPDEDFVKTNFSDNASILPKRVANSKNDQQFETNNIAAAVSSSQTQPFNSQFLFSDSE